MSKSRNETIFELLFVIKHLVNTYEKGFFNRQELTTGYIIATNKSYYAFEKEFLYLITAFDILIKEKKNYFINWKTIKKMYKQFPQEVEDGFKLKEEKEQFFKKKLIENGVIDE